MTVTTSFYPANFGRVFLSLPPLPRPHPEERALPLYPFCKVSALWQYKMPKVYHTRRKARKSQQYSESETRSARGEFLRSKKTFVEFADALQWQIVLLLYFCRSSRL